MFYIITNETGLYFNFLKSNWTANLSLATVIHYNEGEDVTNKKYFFLNDYSGEYQTVLHPEQS